MIASLSFTILWVTVKYFARQQLAFSSKRTTTPTDPRNHTSNIPHFTPTEISTAMTPKTSVTALALITSSGALTTAQPHASGGHNRHTHSHHQHRRSAAFDNRQDADIPTINQPMVGPPVVHPVGQSYTQVAKRQGTDIPAIDQPMVGPPKVHPVEQDYTQLAKRQGTDVSAINEPMVGPPIVHPVGQSYTPPAFGDAIATAALTASTTVPSATATASEKTTLTLEPTMITPAVYDGTLVAVASFTEAPTATMADALPGCTPICKQVNEQDQCVAVAGCVGSHHEDAKAKSEGVVLGTQIRFRAASVFAGLLAVGMAMWML